MQHRKKLTTSALIFLMLIVFVKTSEAAVITFGKHSITLKPPLKKLSTRYFWKKMKSGLTQRLFFKIEIKKNKSKTKKFIIIKFCKVTYDLWDEIYSATCITNNHKSKKTFKKKQKLFLFLTSFKNISCPYSLIDPGTSYKIKLNFNLNPVSKKLLKKVRLWLRQSDVSGSQNYMGAILSMFVNKNIGKSDMSFVWKSKQSSPASK